MSNPAYYNKNLAQVVPETLTEKYQEPGPKKETHHHHDPHQDTLYDPDDNGHPYILRPSERIKQLKAMNNAAGAAAVEKSMWRQGETMALLEYLDNTFSEDARNNEDHSTDCKFEDQVADYISLRDHYLAYTSFIYMLIKGLTILPLFFVLSLPYTLFLQGLQKKLPLPCDSFYESNIIMKSGGFLWVFLDFFFNRIYFWLTLAPILFLSYGIDLFLYTLFNTVFWLVFNLPTCCSFISISTVMKNFQTIRPLTGGPCIWYLQRDFMVAALGQIGRNSGSCYGPGVVLSGKFAATVSVVPIVKYYVNCNPWMWRLTYRRMQQISTSMRDLHPETQMWPTARQVLCRCRQADETLLEAERKKWHFVPHYPFPKSGGDMIEESDDNHGTNDSNITQTPVTLKPQDRFFHLGMQSCDQLIILTHTTHNWLLNESGDSIRTNTKLHLDKHLPHYHPKVRLNKEFSILSNSVYAGSFRVILWYNNPYHFITGFVEAQQTNGGAHQRDTKFLGGEHPMWCVCPSESRVTSLRVGILKRMYEVYPCCLSPPNGENCVVRPIVDTIWQLCTGLGSVDSFFDRWLPELMYEVRLLVRGQKAADELYELVKVNRASVGISDPEKGLYVPRWEDLRGRGI